MSAIDFFLATEGGDILTTEGGDWILLYSFADADAIMYGLMVDWDGDGQFGNNNSEESRVLKWAVDRGRTRLIGGKGRGFEPYRVGTLRIDLDNSDGRYNPYNTGGDLYGILDPGKQMKFQAAVYSESEPLGFTSYDIFTGYMTNLVPQGWNKIAYMECEDGLGQLQGTEIEQVGTRDFDDNVAGLVERIAELANYPFNVDASNEPAGDEFLAYFYIAPNDALKELYNLTSATLGSIACEGDGTLVYHSIHDDDLPVVTLTDENTLKNLTLPNPWDFRRDQVVVHGYQLDLAAAVNPRPVYENKGVTPRVDIEAGSSVTLNLKYNTIITTWDGTFISKTFVGGIPINNLSSMQVWSSTTGNFDDRAISAFVPATVDYNGVDFITLTFHNTSGVTRYVHEVVFLSSPAPLVLYQFNKLDRKFTYGTPIPDRESSEFIIRDNLYWSVFAWLFSGGVYYSSVLAWITDAQQARVDRLGNILASYLASNIPHPTLQIEGRTDLQFTIDVEKRVTYNSDTLGISGDYRVAGLRHETLGSPQAVRTTVYLYPLIPST
jgi:hypothetical protein